MNAKNPFSPYQKQVAEFLDHSNRIEREYSFEAFEDALKAWEYIENKESITLWDILEVHKILMQRLNKRIAGDWRNCSVRIGGELKVFVSKSLLADEVSEVLELMNNKPSYNSKIIGKEDLAKHCHIQFERIHPFEDGNGRVGRILYNWHRRQMGLPIQVIHEGKEQREYYKWFKE